MGSNDFALIFCLPLPSSFHPHFCLDAHTCRTQTKTDKLRYLRNASLWFVDDACSNGSAMAVETIRSKKVGIGACCVDPMAGVATARLR